MSDINIYFQIPGYQKAEKFIAKLEKKVALQIAFKEYSVKKFFDSFDWRLYKAGLLCELNCSQTLSQLRLIEMQSGQQIASAKTDEVPTFADDIGDSGIKSKLKPVLEMRALIPLTLLPYRAYHINILNNDQKTTVRIRIEEYEDLPHRLCIQTIRGYQNAALRISKLLEKSLGLTPINKSVLHAALKLQGRKPLDYSSKLNIELAPNMRADMACKKIYKHLLRAIKVNESGAIAAIDSEFLHDLRVAVRRTRSGLSQIKNVFPSQITQDFAVFFAWLGQVTSKARDMDVYVLNFTSYKQSLPDSMQDHIAPLYAFLKRKQVTAQKELSAKLKSPEYLSKLRAWESFLKEPVIEKPVEPNATRNIRQLACKRIWKNYRRVLKEGTAITGRSAPEALHELRKTCKKLRYLMEFFQSLYPKNEISQLIKVLKNFQDILGDFQDYEIQEQNLRKFGEEMMRESTPTETFLAMGVVVQNLCQKRLGARREFSSRFEKFKQPANQAIFKTLFSGELRA